jgi:hypothetical protein
VRSTKSNIKLYNGDENASQHAADYTASPLPKWNTPDEWCTETATDIMQNTGRFLLENTLLGGGNAKKIKIQFITDTSQRDVDTALALSLGMTEASLKYPDLQIDGVSNLRFGHALFEKLDIDDNTTKTRCETNYSLNQTAADIERRLKTVPPPEPGLAAIMTLLETLGGVGPGGSLFSIGHSSNLYLNRTERKLAGAVNVVKLFGQLLFYSRAGDIDPPFLPNASLDDVYQTQEWVSWSRSVLSVDNVEVAIQGAVIADAILQSLEDGHYDGDSCADDYDMCATVFVGHDSNIDAVATALGLRWKLNPPYRSGADSIGEYVPTPPGGAMHFMHDGQSEILALSYLYPVYFAGHGSTWKLNKTGILESVPMTLKLPIDSHTSTRSTDIATMVSSSDSFSYGMRNRMFSILAEYPGARDCYMDIIDRTSLSSSPDWGDESCVLMIIAGVVLLSIPLAICSVFIGKKRQASTTPKQAQHSFELVEGGKIC